MKNVAELKGYAKFRKTGKMLLHHYLEELLNCKVSFQEQKIDETSAFFKIDLLANEKRYVYIIDDNKVVLCTKVFENNKIIAFLPIALEGKKVGEIRSKYLERIASAITITMSRCYQNGFDGAEEYFGDFIQNKVIQLCFAIKSTEARWSYLLSYLKKLCLITFENENFTTGFILTRSTYDYQNEQLHQRNGVVLKLEKPYDLNKSLRPDRRFWYMADGKTAYYLMRPSLSIDNMFIAPKDTAITMFWKNYSLEQVVWGEDVGFRVVNHNQISVISSDGVEFIGIENTWKLRDYGIIKKIIRENTHLNDDCVDCLLYYVMTSSQTNKSTILWIPEEEEKVGDLLASMKKTFTENIDITDERNIESVKRILSSDGVTIINSSGEIVNNGCVVELSAIGANNRKLTGTGESAAKLLAKNGIAIKVSQDGMIKVFISDHEEPYVF